MNPKVSNMHFCLIWICSVVFLFAGCETTKKILGISTRALEEARVDALSETFACSFDECYEAVLGLQRKEKKSYAMDQSNELLDQKAIPKDPDVSAQEDAILEDTGLFDIFSQNRVRGVIVVMGITGNVDTTEVGIFLTRDTASQTRIEISSLSSVAKRKMADGIFTKLSETFRKAP